MDTHTHRHTQTTPPPRPPDTHRADTEQAVPTNGSIAHLAVVAHRAHPALYRFLVLVDELRLLGQVQTARMAPHVILDHVIDRNARVVVVYVYEFWVVRRIRWALVVNGLELGQEAACALCRVLLLISTAIVVAILGHPVLAAVVECNVQVVVDESVRVDPVPPSTAKQHARSRVDDRVAICPPNKISGAAAAGAAAAAAAAAGLERAQGIESTLGGRHRGAEAACVQRGGKRCSQKS